MSAFISGRFVDRAGMRWFCAERDYGRGRAGIVCHSDDGYMTAADHNTFRAWGWQREEHDAAAIRSLTPSNGGRGG